MTDAALYIDTREHHKTFVQDSITALSGQEPTLMKLDVGDYYVATDEYSCLIERKEIGDLLHSMSKDLAPKLARMHELADLPVLLIEGHPAFDASGHLLRRERGGLTVSTSMTLESYHGYLTGLMLKSIPMFHTGSLEESIHWLAHLPTYLTKPYHQPLWYDKTDDRTRLLSLWQCFPGIGYQLAMEIAKQYCLAEVVDYPEKLLEIQKIGAVRLDKVKRFMEAKL